jgi:hypothetical protein
MTITSSLTLFRLPLLALALFGLLESSLVSAFSSSTLASRNHHTGALGSTLAPQGEGVGADADSNSQGGTVSIAAIPRGVHAPVDEINSPEELRDFLNQDDRICVIKFHATWCKSCQRMGLKYQGYANKHGDWVQGQGRSGCDVFNDPDDYEREVLKDGEYRFGSIEINSNAGMCKELGINKLPYIHIYSKGEQLSGFPCGPARFYRLREQLEYQTDLMTQASPPRYAVAPFSEGTTVTPKLLEKLIAMDAKGELKSGRAKA